MEGNQDFMKVVRLGVQTPTWRKRGYDVYVQIKYKDSRLSITGVEGPLANGNASGSCGQIGKSIDDKYLETFTFAPDWDRDGLSCLLSIWDIYHLNDMQPGCVHQMAMGWNKKPIDPSKPVHTYGEHYPGQIVASWNTWGWISHYEHTNGLLTKPCQICGHKYGADWQYMPVPEDILEWLRNLPDTDTTPAWI